VSSWPGLQGNQDPISENSNQNKHTKDTIQTKDIIQTRKRILKT
jgi:hypothetical protein